MPEHSKEPWRRDGEEFVVDADGYGVIDIEKADMLPADISRAIACVNALAGLKPEKIKKLVQAAEAVRQTSYHADGDGEVWCTECARGLRDHAATCTIGTLATALAEVKA
jgi:hypothetical protein